MRSSTTTYFCDKCGKKLSTSHNSLNIMTSLSESSLWSRLHVKILHIHGVNNDSTQDQAELCKTCAIKLLVDAVNRMRKGERATEGTESSAQKNWE